MTVEPIAVRLTETGPRPIVVETIPAPVPPPMEVTVPKIEQDVEPELPVVEIPIKPVSSVLVEPTIQPVTGPQVPAPQPPPVIQTARPVPGSLRDRYQKRSKNG